MIIAIVLLYIILGIVTNIIAGYFNLVNCDEDYIPLGILWLPIIVLYITIKIIDFLFIKLPDIFISFIKGE